ncbi:hypothetical protein [Gimesia algae]|uniref:DUF304 domain-containing protein n=1 Tax=Gimesia algae TaxID=2527971 RepID=A0A517VMX8_9PLAN|nr:hypothetical protein [Gimesia algae]QDT94346.1 hypothetical protein Pan161_60420 [Gimesia algae]
MDDQTSSLWQLPQYLQSLIQSELNEGEKIIWVGTPIPRRFCLRSIGLVLFGIPWTAFALFWIAGAAGFKLPDFQKGFDFFPLFGIPFVLIGLGMLSSPLWMLRKARNTAYILTSNRAVILTGGMKTDIRSFEPEHLGKLHRKQWKDGSGDLIFDKEFRFEKEQLTTTARPRLSGNSECKTS